jgi:hypothetical protein
MDVITCPICRQPNPADNHLCLACGADFSDPDVIAMAPGDSSQMPQSSLGDAGELAEDRFLGISHEGLIEGKSLRRLALGGGVIFLAAFFIPTTVDFRSWLGPLAGLDKGPTLAVLFPLLAAGAGLAMALVGKLDNWVRAAVLVGVGLLGIFLCLPPLGKFAGAPHKVLPVYTIGLLCAGAALAIRMYNPRSRDARYAAIAAAVIVAIGMVIPVGDSHRALTIEFPFYVDSEFGDMALASAYRKGMTHDMMVRMLSLFGLLPLIALPLAAALAWPTPRGVWDKYAVALRPLAWLAALYIPLAFAMMLFNVAGWSEFTSVVARGQWVTFDNFSEALLVGRARLVVLSLFLALWVEIGVVVVHHHFRPDDGAAQ